MDEEKLEVKSEGNRRTTFKRQFDYVLNLIGLMVGFSNVWRFPYMCYKNGGGSFLIAYAFFIIILIFPLIVIESALGQHTGRSAIKVWKFIPLFRGIGYAVPLLMFYFNLHYPVLLTWAARWLVATFSSDTPWTRCDNEWNTDSCLPLFKEANVSQKNGTQLETGFATLIQNQSILLQNTSTYNSSVEEFWERNILNITSGIEHLGHIKLDLLACHVTVWVLVYFAIWKGIEWTSKVVYITATLPVVMLVVVLIRGVTLDGATDGLIVYLSPNVTRLGDFEVWTDAATQVLFSLAVGAGGITSLSQYNKYHHNFYRDSIILVVANGGVSFLSGFATFSVLGFLAYAKNTTVEEVAESGPGLVYIVYPTALSLLPLPQLWVALFFIMLLLLGFDSLFVYHETFMSCLKDQFSRYFKFKWASEIWTAIASFMLMILGLPMLTCGGMYILHLFNNYSVSGWCIYFITFVELIAIGWAYGADRFCDDIKDMLGFDVPRLWFKICWKFVGPVTSLALMLYSLASYRPLKYGRSYYYPVWADALGWMTALSSMLMLPVTAIYVLCTVKGKSLKEKLWNSIQQPGRSEKPIHQAELETLNCKSSNI